MVNLNIQRHSETPLIRQLYQQIRNQILGGQLTAGVKLPSTRDLAQELGISRIVVVEAYELLMAEGFLEGISGSGTYVAAGASLTPFTPPYTMRTTSSKRGSNDLIDFRSGIPALDLFPRKKWNELSQKTWVATSDDQLSYSAPEGQLELREVITAYLKITRGINCNSEQILVTSGSVQGLVLVAQVMLSSPGEVIVEDPANRDIRRIFSLAGGSIYPVPVDEYGIQTELLPKNLNPTLIQVTPSHQYPLGGNLPIQRRIELIKYARERDCYLIEDDYDSEYRYQGPPISALQGLGPERVIYLGTFSKVLFPALRLGYMVIPSNLIEKFRDFKRITDMHSNSFNQLILARFIQEGYFQRHIAKMKKVYRSRRDTLIQTLQASFPNQVRIIGDTTGLHLVVDFEKLGINPGQTSEIEKAGVKIYPVEEHTMMKGTHVKQFIFGYGHLPEGKIEEGIRRLKQWFG